MKLLDALIICAPNPRQHYFGKEAKLEGGSDFFCGLTG
jgi:hypothetical protein